MAEKLSKLRENLSDGAIAAFYTLNGWFLKVCPCFSIDKVKFSFVMKGTEGQKFLDIYMDTDAFDNFCDEVLSGQMQRKVSEDVGDFPNAFVYKTGQSAKMSVQFGSGKDQPYVFQGRDTEANINAFVGVGDWNDVRNMAKLWRRVSKPYYDELVSLFLDSMKRIESFHTDIKEKPEQPVATETPQVTPKGKAKEEPKENPIAVVTGNAQIYTLQPNGPIEKAENYSEAKPCFILQCSCKELDNDVEVIFLSAPIGKSATNFNLLKDRIEKGWRGTFRIEGQMSEYKGKEQLRFTTFYVKGA